MIDKKPEVMPDIMQDVSDYMTDNNSNRDMPDEIWPDSLMIRDTGGAQKTQRITKRVKGNL